MKHILAAIDAGAFDRSVIDAAASLAEMTGTSVQAVHVREGPTEIPEWLAESAHVPLRMLEGPVGATLLEAVEDADVVAGVFAARVTPDTRRPVGSTALHILERAHKPALVVPTGAALNGQRTYRRLLLPLEGSVESSQPVVEQLGPLVTTDVELVVLHVFTAETVPRMLDRPEHELPVWTGEFLTRFCPSASRIELRSGHIGSRVVEVCSEEGADLVVLSWSQDASAGHAAVVHDVLAHAVVPVLLFPVGTGA